MSFVVDASVALGWFLPSQSNAQAGGLLKRALKEGTVVPLLRHSEVANQLGLRLRCGRLSHDDFAAAKQLIEDLSIDSGRKSWIFEADLISFMNVHKLTAYDAVYLELATRLKPPLATFDKELITAARLANISLRP